MRWRRARKGPRRSRQHRKRRASGPHSSADLRLALLDLDLHAFGDGRETALPVADAIDGDEAVEAHAHHAVGQARSTADCRRATHVETGTEQRGGDGIAFARLNRVSLDEDRYRSSRITIGSFEHACGLRAS